MCIHKHVHVHTYQILWALQVVCVWKKIQIVYEKKTPNSAGRPLQRSLIGVFCFFRQILWYLSFWLACQVCVCVFVWMHTCGRERTKLTNARVCAYTCIFILHIKKIWIHVRVCIRTCTYTLDMHHMDDARAHSQGTAHAYMSVCDFPTSQKKKQ